MANSVKRENMESHYSLTYRTMRALLVNCLTHFTSNIDLYLDTLSFEKWNQQTKKYAILIPENNDTDKLFLNMLLKLQHLMRSIRKFTIDTEPVGSNTENVGMDL